MAVQASMIWVTEAELRSTYALPRHKKQLTGACRVHRIVAKCSTLQGVEKTQQDSKSAPNKGVNQHTGPRPRSVVQNGGYFASLPGSVSKKHVKRVRAMMLA